MKIHTNTDEVKLLKKMGNSDSTISSITGLPVGAIQRMTQSIAVYPQRHVRKSQNQGHYRANPFGEPSNPKPVKKLAKSSVPDDEPPEITEAREMLSLGIDADKVAKQLGISREFMHKHLHEHWQI